MSELQIIPTSSVELDKRTNMPFILRCKCKKCGETIEQDLSYDRYLSYPQVGAHGGWTLPPTESVTMYCTKCDEEHAYQVRVLVTLEVV